MWYWQKNSCLYSRSCDIFKCNLILIFCHQGSTDSPYFLKNLWEKRLKIFSSLSRCCCLLVFIPMLRTLSSNREVLTIRSRGYLQNFRQFATSGRVAINSKVGEVLLPWPISLATGFSATPYFLFNFFSLSIGAEDRYVFPSHLRGTLSQKTGFSEPASSTSDPMSVSPCGYMYGSDHIMQKRMC